MPDFYARTANFPATDATTNSPNMQAEFELIEAAMAKLAPYTGHGGELVVINADATGYASLDEIVASLIPDLNASKFTSGILPVASIPNLDADKITTGQFHKDRIPNLDHGDFTGVFDDGNIPNLDASKFTSGDFARPLIGSGQDKLTKLTVQTAEPAFSGTVEGELVFQYDA